MTFGCQVDDAVNLFVLHQLIEGIKVADIHLYKLVIELVLNVFEVGKVSGVGQLIQIDDFILRVLVYKKSNHVATDKSGTTCDYYITFELFHVN